MKTEKNFEIISLTDSVKEVIKNYFNMHESHFPECGLYNVVLTEIEKVLIFETLRFTSNNKIKAANILGINRNTLRKKMEILLKNETENL